jgi:hypothetical protein
MGLLETIQGFLQETGMSSAMGSMKLDDCWQYTMSSKRIYGCLEGMNSLSKFFQRQNTRPK